MIRSMVIGIAFGAVLFTIVFLPYGWIIAPLVWISIFLGPNLRRLIWYKRLPQATLRVDSLEVKYRYFKDLYDGVEIFHAVTTRRSDRNIFGLARIPLSRNTPFFLGVPVHDPSVEPSKPAVFLIEGEVLKFTMTKEVTRCPCARPIPCWTATIYVGDIQRQDDETAFLGVVQLFLLDVGNRKKHPREKSKPIRERIWDWIPNPQPV